MSGASISARSWPVSTRSPISTNRRFRYPLMRAYKVAVLNASALPGKLNSKLGGDLDGFTTCTVVAPACTAWAVASRSWLLWIA